MTVTITQSIYVSNARVFLYISCLKSFITFYTTFVPEIHVSSSCASKSISGFNVASHTSQEFVALYSTHLNTFLLCSRLMCIHKLLLVFNVATHSSQNLFLSHQQTIVNFKAFNQLPKIRNGSCDCFRCHLILKLPTKVFPH